MPDELVEARVHLEGLHLLELLVHLVQDADGQQDACSGTEGPCKVRDAREQPYAEGTHHREREDMLVEYRLQHPRIPTEPWYLYPGFRELGRHAFRVHIGGLHPEKAENDGDACQ